MDQKEDLLAKVFGVDVWLADMFPVCGAKELSNLKGFLLF
jgi:hypothetical protein